MPTVKKWLSPINGCEICSANLKNLQFFVDGKTSNGYWAVMCPKCFMTIGVGLGIGRGQAYDVLTREKLFEPNVPSEAGLAINPNC